MNNKIEKYSQARAYLFSFFNYERTGFSGRRKEFKLERVKFLVRKLELDLSRIRFIHIAGTKGKGSTAIFLSYLLCGCGYKVGLYTSPHLVDLRERIKIFRRTVNGQMRSQLISPHYIVEMVNKFIDIIEEDPKYTKNSFSFFEVMTVIALSYFIKERVDFAVIETGLGGRLDATNIIKPLASIITPIDYDHTHILGNTLRKITYEKAGIIKQNVPVIVGYQRSSVLAQIKKIAAIKNARVYLLGKDFYCERIKYGKNASYFDFIFGDTIIKGLCLMRQGMFFLDNSALALGCLGVILGEDKLLANISLIREALKEVIIEGRFHLVSTHPYILVDAAHNPLSMSVLNRELHKYFSKWKIILIFAASGDKNVTAMLRNIRYTKIILTKFNSPRCFNPYDVLRENKLKDVIIEDNIKKALVKAHSLCGRKHLIVISGSLFLVGEFLKLFKNGKIKRLLQ